MEKPYVMLVLLGLITKQNKITKNGELHVGYI